MVRCRWGLNWFFKVFIWRRSVFLFGRFGGSIRVVGELVLRRFRLFRVRWYDFFFVCWLLVVSSWVRVL